jgi:hypothetical protein
MPTSIAVPFRPFVRSPLTKPIRHFCQSKQTNCPLFWKKLLRECTKFSLHWHNPSGRNMDLGSTQPLTEMSRLLMKYDGTRAETILRLSAKRTSPFKSAGTSVQSTAGSRGVRISVSNAGYTMFRGSVKSTGYPLHSPISPSLPLPCVTVCHHISTGLYQGYLLAGKGDRCVGLTALPSSYADSLEFWEPHPPGTLRTYAGL